MDGLQRLADLHALFVAMIRCFSHSEHSTTAVCCPCGNLNLEVRRVRLLVRMRLSDHNPDQLSRVVLFITLWWLHLALQPCAILHATTEACAYNGMPALFSSFNGMHGGGERQSFVHVQFDPDPLDLLLPNPRPRITHRQFRLSGGPSRFENPPMQFLLRALLLSGNHKAFFA